MNAPEAPAVGEKDYFAAGCLLGILGGAILAFIQTAIQVNFTRSTGNFFLDYGLLALSFGLQFGIAGALAGSRLLCPVAEHWCGMRWGVLLGAVGWLIGALFQAVLWLFSFYVTWLFFFMGLSLLRAQLAPASFGLALLRGLLASAISGIPMSAALILWAEPAPDRPSSPILVCLAWFASYALGLGIVYTLAPKTGDEVAQKNPVD
jgi:hypothetical protein